VYLIVKEAVNNIAKHSGATKAGIQISRTDEGIRFVISDNGCGFDMTQGYEGNGLKNFRTRAEESFITLTIDSTPGAGTTLHLLVPEL
jgi:signal transduction histidine kinase